ncbi:hypothetical protein TWF694_005566 [Orbilia ellipsospora]|uniref:Uncharacterized protein n=1 Tax=Orbilia ellipsospora TaxID=2528407 RepID=A0AAV9WZI3_9PEZI
MEGSMYNIVKKQKKSTAKQKQGDNTVSKTTEISGTRITRSQDNSSSPTWIRFNPSKARIPWLWRRSRVEWKEKPGLVFGSGFGCFIDEVLLSLPALGYVGDLDSDNLPRSSSMDPSTKFSQMCLNVLRIFGPSPINNHYLYLSNTKSIPPAPLEIVDNYPSTSNSEKAMDIYVSVCLLHAIARGCIPHQILELAAEGLMIYLSRKGKVREEVYKQAYELRSLEPCFLGVINENDIDRGKLVQEYDNFLTVVKDLNLAMHPEAERKMNFLDCQKLRKHRLTHSFLKIPTTKTKKIWFPIRDNSGCLALLPSTKYFKGKTLEVGFQAIWDSMGVAKSAEGGHPARHVNVGFPRPVPNAPHGQINLNELPLWIRILPAAEKRFGLDTEKLFADCIHGTNTSSGKYKMKLGLYKPDGNMIWALAEKSTQNPKNIGPPLRIEVGDYVFMSENPFQLYQTWIHRACVSEYIGRGAPRPFPNFEKSFQDTPEKIEEEKPATIQRKKRVEEFEEEKHDPGPIKKTRSSKVAAQEKKNKGLPKLPHDSRDNSSLDYDNICDNLSIARQGLAAAVENAKGLIWNEAAIAFDPQEGSRDMMFKKDKEDNSCMHKLCNPLVVSISAKKIANAVGKRTGLKTQGTIMGSASQIANSRFGWTTRDTYILNTYTGNTNTEGDDDTEALDNENDRKVAFDMSRNDNKVTGEDRTDITDLAKLQVQEGFHSFYIAEWLHLSAFSWGGLLNTDDEKDDNYMTSQTYWNLIFGTSETNSVMTRFEKAWQTLFEDEAEIFFKDYGKIKEVKGWLLIEKDPPGTKVVHEKRPKVGTEDGHYTWDTIDPYESRSREDWQANFPWISFYIRYTIILDGPSRILSRNKPSFTAHFYPFTRFFFHSAENSLDTRLFEAMKKRALGSEESEFFQQNRKPANRNPTQVWRRLNPGEKYDSDDFVENISTQAVEAPRVRSTQKITGVEDDTIRLPDNDEANRERSSYPTATLETKSNLLLRNNCVVGSQPLFPPGDSHNLVINNTSSPLPSQRWYGPKMIEIGKSTENDSEDSTKARESTNPNKGTDKNSSYDFEKPMVGQSDDWPANILNDGLIYRQFFRVPGNRWNQQPVPGNNRKKIHGEQSPENKERTGDEVIQDQDSDHGEEDYDPRAVYSSSLGHAGSRLNSNLKRW